MINIDLNNLNPLEKEIYNTLTQKALSISNIKIIQAAEFCNCSISKISKVVKKLGFKNYKQFMSFLYGETISVTFTSNELNRLKQFIDDFDSKVVDDFIDLINKHERIILFGYGPSYIVAQYFEYKLHTITNKYSIAMQDALSVKNMADNKSLLVIFTATGTFKSFEDIYRTAKEKDCTVSVVSEEYNPSLVNNCDNLFWLSKYNQPSELKPHEKSRTIFFIFIEEVIQKLMQSN
jgi:DNA-binding MurR/RpiR family transcriptional regulator